MNRRLAGSAAALVVIGICISGAVAIEPNWVFPGAAWTPKTPETVGVKSSQLAGFASRIGGSGVVIKDGYLIYSWGSYSTVVDWLSASKPVLSTLLFMGINEGRVPSVDALVDDYGWNFLVKDRTMTFRHLADMTSGYALPEVPGSTFSYNDYAIDLYAKTLDLGVFPGEDTNTGLIDEGTSRLKVPLQFQDGWIFGNSNVNRPGLRVKCSPRDFARIGWMWMNKGKWGASQMIPQSFFDNYCKADVPSTTPVSSTYTANDYIPVYSYGGGVNQVEGAGGPGIYGFNWWHNTSYEGTGPLTWPSAPADTYQANGNWGADVMTMFPSLGMVVSAVGSWGTFTRGNANSGMNISLGMITSSVMHQGDTNGDNAVGLIDLGALARCWYGQSEMFWADGDFNHDGKVGILDLSILGQEWGWTAPAPAPAGAPVPEPTSLALLGAAGLGLACRRRHRHNAV